jgi:hypothetical protein
MDYSEYELMQKAVDIVRTSEHPTNKVAAVLAYDYVGEPSYTLSSTNYWPEAIAQKIGRETRIGNASGTVHAETACLLHASHTMARPSMSPMCPARIASRIWPRPVCVLSISIIKVSQKDFALRRGGHFENMSLRICEKAGIAGLQNFPQGKTH